MIRAYVDKFDGPPHRVGMCGILKVYIFD
jgi:hypothetical protein